MKLGIMQPYFLPYIGYWQLLNAVDEYVIYDDVNFIKGGWINRNNYLLNGEAKMFTIPLQGASPNILINQVGVTTNEGAKMKIVKSIEANYRRAPFFSDVLPVFEKIVMYDEPNLGKYLSHSIMEICEYLGINTKILISSELKKNCDLKGKDKVISMCKLLGADEYYNAIGGQELYSSTEFANNGIKLFFLATDKIEYEQFGNHDYVSNLSIIDIMMFNSKEQCKKLLSDYSLINKASQEG